MLADRIELVDVGARREQEARHDLLIAECDGRGGGRRQRGGAPGDQGRARGLRRRRQGQRQKIVRGRGAPLIGHGVPGLDEPHATGLGQVAVLHHDEAAGHALAPRFLDCRGHGPRCLARADDHDAARRGRHGGEGAQHEGVEPQTAASAESKMARAAARRLTWRAWRA